MKHIQWNFETALRLFVGSIFTFSIIIVLVALVISGSLTYYGIKWLRHEVNTRVEMPVTNSVPTNR
jgi:hypothetical protein